MVQVRMRTLTPEWRLNFCQWKKIFLDVESGSKLRRIAFEKSLQLARNCDELKFFLDWTLPATPERDEVLGCMLDAAETMEDLRLIWAKTTSESSIEREVLVRIAAKISDQLFILKLMPHVVQGGHSIKILRARAEQLQLAATA